MTTAEIKTRAKEAGLTLSGLLVLAGINRATFWRWEKGRFAPRAASIERIRGILNQHARR